MPPSSRIPPGAHGMNTRGHCLPQCLRPRICKQASDRLSGAAAGRAAAGPGTAAVPAAVAATALRRNEALLIDRERLAGDRDRAAAQLLAGVLVEAEPHGAVTGPGTARS